VTTEVKPGIAAALRLAYRMERRVREELLRTAEAHRDEHEIHHVAVDLARWSQENCDRIQATADALEVELDAPIEDIDVLASLRRVYLTAAQASLAWEELAQGAQATKTSELVSLAAECHPQTLRQVRWANTMLKTSAPQLLSSQGG
jgi:hypothetical protein